MRSPFLLLASAGLLAACALDTVTLHPASEAQIVATAGAGNAATDAVSGVRVTAASRSWPGRTPIEHVVMPLRVRIDNSSGNPVLLRYDKMVLSSPSGRVYAALPPYSIDATVTLPRLALATRF